MEKAYEKAKIFIERDIKVGDLFIIKHKDNKLTIIKITRIEDVTLVGKIHDNCIQETFINLESLIETFDKYIDYILIDRLINEAYPYTTQMEKSIKEIHDKIGRLYKAFHSNYFCDKKSMLRDIGILEKSYKLMNYELLSYKAKYNEKMR